MSLFYLSVYRAFQVLIVNHNTGPSRDKAISLEPHTSVGLKKEEEEKKAFAPPLVVCVELIFAHIEGLVLV